jgi:hypothetical protein
MYENNTVNLIGYTGKDVNARFTKNNRAFAVVLVATKSSYRDKQSNEYISRTDWHRLPTQQPACPFEGAPRTGEVGHRTCNSARLYRPFARTMPAAITTGMPYIRR